MNEKLLYYLWQQQLTNKQMTTTDQRELIVVRAGQRNINSGPDFLFAQLQLDKMTWAGHVEMHIKSSDWYAHNHHIVKAYDNVILHVVWEEDMPVFTSDDHPLATVVLRDFVTRQSYIATRNYQLLIFGSPVRIESNTSTDLNKWLFLIVFM